MRKLNILRTIIDFLWIIAMLTVPLFLFLFGCVFISDDVSELNFKISGLLIEETNISTILFLFAQLLAYLLLIYGLYLFKKSLRYFQQLKMFDEIVITNFNKIGYILVTSSFLTAVPKFIYLLFHEKKIGFEIGFTPFLLMLCLGIFFMVLSTIFKISKNLKTENELTI